MSKLNTFVNFAKELASLSKCEQRGVAALIVDKDFSQVHSIGINGGAKHGAQCLCSLPGKESCIHAEQNALVKCQVPTEGKVMILTLSPCVQCAALMINAGIHTVYYCEEWKDTQGLIMLKDARITTIKI